MLYWRYYAQAYPYLIQEVKKIKKSRNQEKKEYIEVESMSFCSTILLSMTPPINNEDIQRKCEAFLKELGVPGFIVFGWQKADQQFGVVSSFHEMPVNAALKGLSWALHDFTNKIG